MPDNFRYPAAQRLSLRGTLTALLIVAVSLFELAPAAVAQEHSPADPFSWPTITREAKPWTWWWWPGSAVDSGDIARQLEIFQKAGLGGVQIIPIYGVDGWESQYRDFLSPKWMQMMDFTVAEGRRLGMGVDMALESGWCFGGPAITEEYANAFVVQKKYEVLSGDRIQDSLSRAATQALMAFGPDGRTVNLLGSIRSDGQVDWTAPDGRWHVYAVSQRFSGQNVKRAAPGGRGPMLNPLYAAALQRYLQWFDQAFTGYKGAKPRAVFQDSYEYQCDWAPDFFTQFETLRGYRLQDCLPALFGDAPAEEVARVRSDYRETVSDLLAVKTNPIWITWAHQQRFTVSYQAHGAPANWLDLYAGADIPETEMFRLDRNPLISKFASSAAHVAGHPLTAAETGTWLSEHFTETLAELKFLTDDMFLSGINHIFYHGTCYTPEVAQWPGWLFYASTEMNPQNSIWYDVSALNAYVARCQSILQSGRPDNDILLYWPIADLWDDTTSMLPRMTLHDASWFAGQPIGHTARDLWSRGFAFDYISDRQLRSSRTVSGKIEVPGGSYSVVVSPPCRLIPVRTFAKLMELARSGATVIFQSHLPSDVPGWGHLAQRRVAFKKLTDHIHLASVGESLQEATVGRGRILVGDGEAALRRAAITREAMTDHAGVYFVRRRMPDGRRYFIANRSGTAFEGWVTLGRPARSITIMDPVTGKAGAAATRRVEGKTQVYLQLPQGGSTILRVFAGRRVSGTPWKYWQAGGSTTEVTGTWQVHFVRGGPVLPAPCETKELRSWTTQSDTNAQRFAGTAGYSISFDAPGHQSGRYCLDLGKVCQSARIRLNGQDLGTLITPPFRVLVDLRTTGNHLNIEVTNVSANRIRDLDRRQVRWKIFHDINFVNIDYTPFDAAGWPLYDSGLLGPVTLTPATVLTRIHQ